MKEKLEDFNVIWYCHDKVRKASQAAGSLLRKVLFLKEGHLTCLPRFDYTDLDEPCCLVTTDLVMFGHFPVIYSNHVLCQLMPVSVVTVRVSIDVETSLNETLVNRIALVC